MDIPDISPPDAESTDVLILGASARAAAMSAVRAGWRVWAADLFGDEDLQATAFRYRAIKNYRELPDAIADWPTMPWIATGALENHPKLIERLSKERPFWGTPPEVMRKVRSPRLLYHALIEAGRPALAIWLGKSAPPPDGRWMLKPKRSAGGQGVMVWDESAAGSAEVSALSGKPHDFQQRAEGEPMSALFLSEGERISLIGVSRLLNANAPGPPFGYGGAVGPIVLKESLETEILEQGFAVGRAFALRGLWGMDFLCDGSRAWVCEINPRYTATVELYEQALGRVLFPLHRLACDNWNPAQGPPILEERPTKPAVPRCLGKIVIYADRDLTVPSWEDWATARDALLPGLSVLADRPRAGSAAARGFPVCSLLAAGTNETECRRALNERLKAFETHFAQAGISLFVPRVAIG